MFHDNIFIIRSEEKMSIMTQLEFELDFSESEKDIARYILDKQENVLDLPIKKLANETYTSPATIVRLCHKLGLQGYGDFKKCVAEAVIQELTPIQKKAKEYLEDKSYLEKCYKDAAREALEISVKNLNIIKEKIGFII